MSKPKEMLKKERAKRVQDAISLQVPDRVPFVPFFHFFPAKYSGITCQEAMYDYDKLADAWKRTLLDFEPDMYNPPYGMIATGPLLETLDCKQLKWPGHGVDKDNCYQFIEKEYMKPEEYDDFLFDPTNFVLRIYLPRVYGALSPLKELPSISSMLRQGFLTSTAALAIPEVTSSINTLLGAGLEAHKMLEKARAFSREMEALGFPCQFGATAYAPFDYIGDSFRGTRGIMLDMLSIPEKLLALMDKVTEIIVQGAISSTKRTGVSIVFMPIHKGLDTFMSPDHFKTFFWPSLKKVMLTLIDEELTPCVFWEGDCTSRLEVIRDIPEGKAIYYFEKTNIFEAKKILREVACIRGNVPASLLCTGRPQDIKEYCKQLIEIVGKGGGFILDGGVGIPDEAKAENVMAMSEAVKLYCAY